MLPEAQAALAWSDTWYDRDYPAAERRYKGAIEIDPKFTQGYRWYAAHLAMMGRLEESRLMMQRGQEFEPLSSPHLVFYSTRLLWQGRTNEAIEHLRTALAIDSGFFMAHWAMGLVQLKLGRYDDAIAEFKRPGTDLLGVHQDALLGYAHARAGNAGEARRYLARLERKSRSGEYVPGSDPAIVLAGLNDRERALDWLERLVDQRGTRIWLQN